MRYICGMNTKLESKQIEKISKALGDSYRRQILDSINKEHDWLHCTVIIDSFNLAQSTVWHHIKTLLDADLLIGEKDGRNAKYKINHDVFDAYIKFLSAYSNK